MPFVFRCGRLVVLVLDARGDRDVFRKDYPILGTEQWGFIDTGSPTCQRTWRRWR